MQGAPTYDFLSESFLFEESQLDRAFAGVTGRALENELLRYREFIDAHLDQLDGTPVQAGQFPPIFAGEGLVDLSLLKQCAWYVPSFIVQDPLYELTAGKSNAQEPTERLLGVTAPTEQDRRRRVANALKQLRSLMPMVAAGYVRLLPISRLFEVPAQLPLIAPANHGAELLPAELMSWFRQRSRVLAASVIDGSVVARRSTATISPCRSIAVEFSLEGVDSDGGEGSDPAFIYHLFQQKTVSVDEESRTFHALVTFPDEPPSKAEFEVWVQQSVHQSAAAFARRTLREVSLAGQLKSRYLTTSPFKSEFLGLAASTQSRRGDAASRTVNALLALDVPLLDGVDVADIMRVRQEDGELFQAFREMLEARLRPIELESDPERRRTMVAHVREELISTQLGEIGRKVSRLRSKSFTEAGIAIASLAAAIPTSGLTLLGAVAAGLQLVKTRAEFSNSVRDHPAYFLWRVRQESRQ